MPVQQENIPIAADESFRLLRWSHSVKSVSIVRGGIENRIQGQGDHWHYHRASELTFIERGSGMRFIAEQQEAIQRAVSYILAHYRDPIRLEDLHRLTSMSRSTFARQFRHHIGKPYSTFLNQVRLQAVCRALRETKSPIGVIALDHGFNQLSFFNRLFQRECGMSPGQYREQSVMVG